MNADASSAVVSLVEALEAGNYDAGRLVGGAALQVEDLSSVMWCTEFFWNEDPRRVVDGQHRPVLLIWGRHYEFEWSGQAWVQAPGTALWRDPMQLTKRVMRRTNRKRLTPHQVRRANRRLRRLGIKT